MALDLRDTGDGVTLRVRVKPRASRDAIGGEREGALVVRLSAPPVEGAANARSRASSARRSHRAERGADPEGPRRAARSSWLSPASTPPTARERLGA